MAEHPPAAHTSGPRVGTASPPLRAALLRFLRGKPSRSSQLLIPEASRRASSDDDAAEGADADADGGADGGGGSGGGAGSGCGCGAGGAAERPELVLLRVCDQLQTLAATVGQSGAQTPD